MIAAHADKSGKFLRRCSVRKYNEKSENMIGIIGAMDVEVDALKKMMDGARVRKISDVEFVSGKIHDKDVVVAVCSVGKVFAAIAAEAMILSYNPDVIINSGVAGALSDKLGIADIVIADKVVQHDMNTTAFGDPRGLISGLNIVEIPCSERVVKGLKKAADESGLKNFSGVVASGDIFVDSRAAKDKIAKTFKAVACEMEGASIGHVCYVNGVEFGVLRSISDSLTEESNMEYSEFVGIAAENSHKVIERFIKEF